MRRIARMLVAASLLASGCAWAELEDELRTLLDQGRHDEAFRLGKSSPERQGIAAFDFFYGIAAIESGHPGEGVEALERFLRDYPDNRSARYQLARAYYALGDDRHARETFEALLPRAVGEEKLAIERFLDAIRARQARHRPSSSAFLEFGIGFDSNVNAGLSSGSTPSIPGIGSMPALSGGSLAAMQRASFSSLSGEATVIYPIASGLALNGSLAFDARTHGGGRNDVFDQLNAGASVGVSRIVDASLYKIGAGLNQMGVDNQRYVFTGNLFAEWDYQLDRSQQLDLAAQVGRYSHDDMLVFPDNEKSVPRQLSQNALRSSDFAGVTAGWTWMRDDALMTTLRLSGNLGRERNRRDRPDLSRDMAGLRAVLSIAPTPRLGLMLGVSYLEAWHKATFALPGATISRRDRVGAFETGVSYQYDRNLSLKADYIRQKQESNIDFYLYEREVLTFRLRYDFK